MTTIFFAAQSNNVLAFKGLRSRVSISPARTAAVADDNVPIEPAVTVSDIVYDEVVNLPMVSGNPIVERYPADNREFELEILRLVNLERANAGLPPLIEDQSLTQAARRHAIDMAISGQRGHSGSDGSTPALRMWQEGYAGTPWTEASSFNYPSPQDVVNGWLNSASHRDIVLDTTASDIGIGYAHNSAGGFEHTCVIDLGVAHNSALSPASVLIA
jgi:uncharacterized protein YkwD